MKVNLKRIADEAGVSMTTVTNVIKKRTNRVSEEKIELIESIIKKYNYTPNMNARSLSNSSSNLIGLLYHSEGERINFSDPFVSEVLAGIEEKAKDLGYFVLVYNFQSIEDIIAVQNNWKFEGFIVVGVLEKIFEGVQKEVSEDTPVVFVDTHFSNTMRNKYKNLSNRFFICSADEKAGYDATKFILEQGHENIAFLSFKFNPDETGVINERFMGFIRAIKENGNNFNKKLLFTNEDFETIAKSLDKFTAIVVSSDFLAVKLIHYLRRKGLFNKDKLSIVGFDDVSYAQFLEPPLTTIRLNQKNKGVTAFNVLYKVIQKEPVEKFITLPGELVIRESVTTLNIVN
ncbi:LacI family DNA-binding transcriptional regulator [Bacillus sp. FJAT-49711]|uniref:LacI family DNA-binding transcriptional regulator n=1 Tax=Bacillus sp. FJAT-49711 TaxID=2833585 RepID=UPI001BC9B94A|nr:LacI family DNA-binding transcriptional regulator [Bacillus sp. FJAT-49711]MBS4218522.1 LacI family DNA-binding transcriptional regulator [Bacillus sp. FJAT-49711]